MAIASTWNHLPDVDDALRIDDNAQACLTAVREVLDRYGCIDRFGVTLLHKHFEMDPDEILVELFDHEKRELVTRPVKAELVPESSRRETQWSWKRDANGEATLVCIEQCVVINGQHPKTHY